MKTVTLLFLVVFPAYGQVTKANLQTLREDLRIIIKEESPRPKNG